MISWMNGLIDRTLHSIVMHIFYLIIVIMFDFTQFYCHSYVCIGRSYAQLHFTYFEYHTI